MTIGELIDVIETGANDVYEVKTPDGGHVLLLKELHSLS